MPRPPILPTIYWRAVFDSGLEYADWLKGGESPENQQKMEALRQTVRLEVREVAALRELARPVHVVAIAEDWCGDVVRHVPVLQRLADVAKDLRVRYISRSQWPAV